MSRHRTLRPSLPRPGAGVHRPERVQAARVQPTIIRLGLAIAGVRAALDKAGAR